MADSKELDAKQRIIKHMNADHQDSIIRYAEHYCHVFSFFAANASMVDISLDRMKINAGGQVHSIPFQPPMQSLRDARERVVQMDKEACKALDRSDITVKEYVPPSNMAIVGFIAFSLGFSLLYQEQNVATGSIIQQYAPPLASFIRRGKAWVLVPILVIHLVEAIYLARAKLAKHTVPFMSGLWWKWIVSCTIEGVGSLMRFNALIARKQKEKEKQRH